MAKFRPLPRVTDLQKRSADYFKISIYAKKSKLFAAMVENIHFAVELLVKSMIVDFHKDNLPTHNVGLLLQVQNSNQLSPLDLMKTQKNFAILKKALENIELMAWKVNYRYEEAPYNIEDARIVFQAYKEVYLWLKKH
ncbi:MAG: HEPN domain-containing protein [Pseudobdellovibrionaceae bacterium]